MTDKEKILQEIERLQKPTMDANHNFTSDYNQGLYDGLSQLELFIESLPEEKKPIREYVSPEDSTLGKLLKEMKDFSPQEDLGISNEEYNDFVNELIFDKEESVSNDLEEAAKQYPSVICHISPQWKSEVENVFKAGAQWQKEQFEKNRLEHCDNITEEQYNLETGFIDYYLDKYHRMPTFLDAIEYGMKKAMEE